MAGVIYHIMKLFLLTTTPNDLVELAGVGVLSLIVIFGISWVSYKRHCADHTTFYCVLVVSICFIIMTISSTDSRNGYTSFLYWPL